FEAAPPPAAVVVAQTGTSSTSTLSAYTNYAVVLNGSSSTVPAGHSKLATWTLDSLPSGSTASLSFASGDLTGFVADKPGTYVVTFHLVDVTTGATSTYTTTVNVADGPTAVVTGGASPVAAVSAPTFVSAPGVAVTLRGGGSYAPGGGTLTYLWSIV